MLYEVITPYFEHFDAWVDADRAHPKGDQLFARQCEQAVGWGAIQIEQDWMVETFMGVRGLREAPGRRRFLPCPTELPKHLTDSQTIRAQAPASPSSSNSAVDCLIARS